MQEGSLITIDCEMAGNENIWFLFFNALEWKTQIPETLKLIIKLPKQEHEREQWKT